MGGSPSRRAISAPGRDAAIGQSFRHMDAPYRRTAFEIGQSPRYPKHTMIAPRRQLESLDRLSEQLRPVGLRRRDLAQEFAIRFRVGADPVILEAHVLDRPRLGDPRGDLGAAFGRR